MRELGIPAEFSGRNDMTVDGKKFSGNAQYKLKNVTVHHGSLLFDTDIKEMVMSTKADEYKIVSKSIKSAKERVTNLRDHLPKDISGDEFKKHMVAGILGDGAIYKMNKEDKRIAAELGEKHFNNWDKIFGASPKFNIEKEKRFAGGRMKFDILVERGCISDIKISGDFFSAVGIDKIEDELIGVEYKEEEIRNALDKVVGKDEVYNISVEDILSGII